MSYPPLPTGTVTFLFTDIEGSTRLWEKHPEAMKSMLARHDSILKEAAEAHRGHIIKTTGDGIHAVFPTAFDSVQAALEAQWRLQEPEFLGNPDVSLRVRMGIHTGEAELRNGDYYGSATNRAARIMSVGHGGQVLLSGTTMQVSQDHLPEGLIILDLGQHHLRGLSKAEKIYQISTPGLQQEFPALRSLTHATNNLPTQLTSFIGRERELAEAKARLEGARLLTLIGPGGTGKTRLSIELGSQLLPSYKDGAWLVELAPISDPALVMQTIATTLEVREQAGMPLEDLVCDYLREKELLLILDNCEHLVEACAKIADVFLHVAPGIQIIASSREALGIMGETIYRVPSLSLPEQQQLARAEALKFESVQLFVARASAANPRFQLTDENAPAVAQICSRLDGIPLAIELAASRTHIFPPEQIAKRLDDRFKLLTGGSRTALPRQQTLRALIDWSYDLLEEPERALFRRLSVFSGGWSFEAAEAVCSSLDVFEHLPQLINKSLVLMNEEGDEPRYSLLETIRQYARDKLLEAGEGEGTRDRHFAYYLAMAETAYEEIFIKEKELGWIHKLATEYDNIRTAIEWGLASDPIAVMKMVYSLGYFLISTSYSVEGHHWAEKALALAVGEKVELNPDENLHKARLLTSMSNMSFTVGDNQTTYQEAREAAQILRTLDGEIRSLSYALTFLASAAFTLGYAHEAIATAEEALALAEEAGDGYLIGNALTITSRVEAFIRGDFAKAYELHEKACALLKEHGTRWAYGLALYLFGSLYLTGKQLEKAREQYNLAMEALQGWDLSRRINLVKSDLAHILRYECKYREALWAYRETIQEWQRIGHRSAVAHQIECFASIATALGQMDTAAQLFGAAEALRERIGIDMTTQEREEYAAEVAGLQAMMGANEFSARWAEGRTLTTEQAMHVAFGVASS